MYIRSIYIYMLPMYNTYTPVYIETEKKEWFILRMFKVFCRKFLTIENYMPRNIEESISNGICIQHFKYVPIAACTMYIAVVSI